MADFPQSEQHPSSVLAALLEPLVDGRRVAILGDATLPLADALAERGARLIHLYDPDIGRVKEALAMRASYEGRRPVVAELVGDFAVREGVFDVVVITDLAELEDAEHALQNACRLTADRGTVVVASPNPAAERFLLPPSTRHAEALDYYDLYDLLSSEFTEVRMLGQAPFVGYSLVDFSAEDPDVALDTSVLPEPETPEWFLAIGSERTIRCEEYSVVALPVADIARQRASREQPAPVSREPVTQPLRGVDQSIELAETRARLLAQGAEIEKLKEAATGHVREQTGMLLAQRRVAELEETERRLRGRLEDYARSQAEDTEQAARLASAQESAARKVRELEGQVAELSAQLAATAKQSAAGTSEVTAARRAFEERERELLAQLAAATKQSAAGTSEVTAARRAFEERERELTKQVAAKHDEATQLSARLADERKDRNRAEVDARAVIGRLEQELASRVAADSSPDPSQFADLDALESRLVERGAELSKLRRDLVESEEFARELLWRLDVPISEEAAPPPAAEVTGSNGGASRSAIVSPLPAVAAPGSDLGSRLARSEADRTAAEWRLQQLEREIAELKRPEPETSSAREQNLELALAAAQREIAELRQLAHASGSE